MTYEEMIATRPQRLAAAAQARANACACCGVPFSQYGLTRESAYHEGNAAYCNSDCALVAESSAIEAAAAAWMAEE